MVSKTLFANGATLKGPAGRPQLYKNDGKGHFTDVAIKAGLTQTGWAQGVCAGDYDNDGHTDLLVTYYGTNRLYRNRGNSTFEDATAKANLPTTAVRADQAVFLDYDRDGRARLIRRQLYRLESRKTAPRPGHPHLRVEGLKVMCGPPRPPSRATSSTATTAKAFTDVSEAAGILKPGGRCGLGATAADFDNDGWPDIYVACGAIASLLFHNNHDGTFEERGVEAERRV